MPTSTLRLASSDELDGRRAVDGPRRSAVTPTPWAARAAVLVPAFLMLCLGLVGLDRHSVWRDEAASLVAARRSLPELWTMLGNVETVHALYYTLLHAWLQLGGGEVWARVPSVLAMTAAAGLVAAVGSRLVSPTVGLVAGLLFAVNPSVSYYAQEARSTALVAAVALLAVWFLLRAVDRRPGWWAAYAVACLVLIGLNLLAVLVPLSLVLTLLAWGRTRRVLLRWALATAPALLLTGVLLAVTSRQPFQVGWIPRPGVGSLRDLAHLALGPTLPLVVLGALLVLAGMLPGGPRPERRLRALAVPLLVLPPAALLAASFVQPVFVARYVFPSVAPAALLAALGVVRLARAVVRRPHPAGPALVAAAAVLLVSVVGVGAQRAERTPGSRPDDLAGAADIIDRQAAPGDVVLFLPDNRRLLSLVYPGSFDGVRDVSLAQGPDATGNLTGRPLPLATTLENLSASRRVWVVGRPGLQLLPSETDAQAELELLRRDFRPVQRTGSHGVGIALYVPRSTST
ncbi:hypothetical protein GCM10022197_02800 [Microlunatus spumicola]|uniref:Glycosyltransferase RgtA/B/C/D-like domain-containing protein n=1 Tax=Microlunatus spumicola TaxID=81499 RepID=A0ABP6WID7_9ACTN